MIKNRNILFWLAVTIGFFVFLYLIRSVLLPFVLGMATAYFLDPAADKLQQWKCSRNVATLTITSLFFSLIILAVFLGVPLIASQISTLLNAIPDYIATFNRDVVPLVEQKLSGLSPSLLADIKGGISSSTGLVASAVANFFTGLLTSGIAFINILSLVLITPVVAFYLLRDWDRITASIDALLPRKHADVIREQLAIIDKTLAGFLRGQLNVCLLLGLYYAVGLSLIGLNSGFLIGMITGFLVIFPYVGLLVGMASGMAVAFFQFDDVTPIALVLAVFVSGQILEGNFVTPKLVGEKVGLHPVWVIFAMLAGAALFGFVGILIAVPFAAVVGVLTRFAINQYHNSAYYE